MSRSLVLLPVQMRSVNRLLAPLLLVLLTLPVSGASKHPPLDMSRLFQDPRAQTPDWSRPLRAPFVDIFHLLPENRLLVGAMQWDAIATQFHQGDLQLLSVADGTTLWTAKREWMPHAGYSLVGMQQSVIVLQATAERGSKVFAYDAGDGKLRWGTSIEGSAAVVTVVGGAVLTVNAEEVSALDVSSGRPLWTKRVEPRRANALPQLVPTADGLCIVSKKVTCLDPTTGAERWSQLDTDASPVGRALLAGPRLVTVTDTGATAWSLDAGKQLWRVSSPVQGLADVSTDDTTLYAEWLDSDGAAVRIQAVSANDGKVLWVSEPVPVPRSAIIVNGNIGYFSSASMLASIDVRTGRVIARALLPIWLIDTDRRPDDIRPEQNAVTVFGERGGATFSSPELKLLRLGDIQAGGSSADAERNLKEQTDLLARNTPSSLAAPPSVHIAADMSSAMAKAARTRIQLAYVHERPVLESSTASHSEKALAHSYIAQEISGGISMQRQAFQLEQVQAAADLSNAALAFAQAFQEIKRRDLEANLAMHRYHVLASALRYQGTPPGYALAGESNRIEVFDSSRDAVGTVYHSSESAIGWVHLALLTEDGSHLIGAHLGHSPSQRRTSIDSTQNRPDMDIESYPLSKAVWKKAEPPKPGPEDALIAAIRSGSVVSLRQQYGPCYFATSTPLRRQTDALILAAIAARNVNLLREMGANGGTYRLTRSTFGFDPLAIARDIQDRDVVAVLEETAAQQRIDSALADAIRADDRKKAKAAIEAGAHPDGYAPLSDTRMCSWPFLSSAGSEAMRQLLIDTGAHVNVVSEDSSHPTGQTPLDIAVAQKNESLERYLRAHGGKSVAELSN